jgi:hypothetical protein
VNQINSLSQHGNPDSETFFDDLALVVDQQALLDNQFESIIIDEVQDFCSRGAVGFLQSIVKQNPNAKIRMFGDFENQSVQIGQPVLRENFMKKFPDLRSYRLTRNCRNRPGIGSAIEFYTQKSDLYLGFRLPATGNNLKSCVADTSAIALKQCEAEFARLSKRYLPSEIVILGLTHEINIDDFPANFSQVLTNNHTTWRPGGPKSLSTTVRKFKGMDAQAVILTNLPDSVDIDLMYTGMSRAIEEIVIIGPRVVLSRFVGIPSN